MNDQPDSAKHNNHREVDPDAHGRNPLALSPDHRGTLVVYRLHGRISWFAYFAKVGTEIGLSLDVDNGGPPVYFLPRDEVEFLTDEEYTDVEKTAAARAFLGLVGRRDEASSTGGEVGQNATLQNATPLSSSDSELPGAGRDGIGEVGTRALVKEWLKDHAEEFGCAVDNWNDGVKSHLETVIGDIVCDFTRSAPQAAPQAAPETDPRQPADLLSPREALDRLVALAEKAELWRPGTLADVHRAAILETVVASAKIAGVYAALSWASSELATTRDPVERATFAEVVRLFVPESALATVPAEVSK